MNRYLFSFHGLKQIQFPFLRLISVFGRYQSLVSKDRNISIAVVWDFYLMKLHDRVLKSIFHVECIVPRFDVFFIIRFVYTITGSILYRVGGKLSGMTGNGSHVIFYRLRDSKFSVYVPKFR